MIKPKGLLEVDAAPSRVPGERRRSESGDTLIEVLLAVVVLGITSVAILLAFSTSILGSATHRNLVTLDTVLRSSSESATNQIQQQLLNGGVLCSGANSVVFSSANGYALPAGYTAQVASTYWNGAAFVAAPSPCPANAPQLMSVTVTANGSSSSLSTVVDDPVARPLPTYGSATQLVFAVQPGNGVSGSPLAPQPVIDVEDSNNQLVTTDLSNVHLLITSGTGTSGATVTGCTGNEFFGVVTFTNCIINTSGSNYTLTAIDSGIGPGSSGVSTQSLSFKVSPAAASQLVFTTSPGNGTAGTAFGQPVVTVEDAAGNTATADFSTVALAITSGTGTSGAVLSACAGTETLGVVTFAGCAITTTGSGYTLTASDGAVTSAVSTAFNISSGAASQLVFTTSPGNSVAGAAFAAQPVVTVVDAFANTVLTDASTVTVSIYQGPSGASVSSTCSGREASGVVTFTGCSIAIAGTNYTLTARDGNLASAVSSAFNITTGAAAKFAITSNAISGTAATTATLGPVTVQEQDASGNPTTTAEVATLTSNTTGTPIFAATSGGTAITTITIPVGSSTATFYYGDNKTGTPTIAASGPLSSGTQTETITPGGASKLAITSTPLNVPAGTTATNPFTTTLEDANGNPTTTTTATTITLNSTSTGRKFAAASNGASVTTTTLPANTQTVTAYYADTVAGAPSITASSGSLGSGIQIETINPGGATNLAFAAQPSATSTAGTPFAAQPVVTIKDAYANPVIADTSTVTLGITNGTGTTGATVNSCTGTETSGVVTFSGCTLTTVGTAYTLTARDGTLNSAISSAFNITPAAAASFAVTNPGAQTAGAGFSATITALDPYGNTATTYSGSKTLTFTGPANSPNATAPTYPTNIAFTSGSATASITLFDAQTTTLSANQGSLTGTSTNFTVLASNTFAGGSVINPGPQIAGVAFNVTVAVLDPYGNTFTGFTGSAGVTFSGPANSPSSATPTYPASLNFSSGIAVASLILPDAQTTTLAAASSGISATSTNFTVAPAAGAKLTFTTQPSTPTTAGTPFATQPAVTVRDAYANTATADNSAVALTITSGTGTTGATVNNCTGTETSGVVAFTGCTLTTAGTAYTLTATDGTLASATSSAFSINAAAASKFVITSGAVSGTAASGSATVGPITVQEQDANGNPTTTAETATLTSNTTGTPRFAATSGGTAITTITIPAGSSTATFYYGDTKAGTPTITASGPLTAATQTETITAGAATKVVITTSPGSSTGATAFAVQPQATVEDAGGNAVTTSAVAVTLAINTGTGTLACNTNPVSAVAGVATFAGCKITLGTAGSFTLKATATSLTTGISSTFNES